jgi:hypothetical protein
MLQAATVDHPHGAFLLRLMKRCYAWPLRNLRAPSW